LKIKNLVGITIWLNLALMGATSGSIAKVVFKNTKTEHSSELTLFGWDGDLMIWESKRSSKEKEN
jgi:hypothetical protein